jgi:hypothetical protein
LQLYRSRSNRAKQRKEIDEAIRVAANGSKVLLVNGYDAAGYELATVLLELLEENERDLDADIRTALIDVDNSFLQDSPNRLAYLKACVKWSAAQGQRKLGEPLLHSRLAFSLWACGEQRLAMYHFAAGEIPKELVQKLCSPVMAATSEIELERDRLMTLGTLHFLSLENLRDATEFIAEYRRGLKALGKKDYQSDLLTFSDYLVQTARRDALPLFRKLCNAYAHLLNFDPAVGYLIQGPIGQRLFNLEAPRTDVLSLLQGMLR